MECCVASFLSSDAQSQSIIFGVARHVARVVNTPNLYKWNLRIYTSGIVELIQVGCLYIFDYYDTIEI